MQKLMNSNVSGIIIVPTVNNVLLDGYRELKDHGIKYVFCNRRVEGLNAPKVVGNDFYGSNLVTKYLLSKGRKKPSVYLRALLFHLGAAVYWLPKRLV